MRNVLSLAALACLFTTPVLAQDGPELIPEKVVGPGQDLRGVRIAVPGALVLASFDQDGSMTITPEEVSDGAKRMFKHADKNGDGHLSIFEQQDWAMLAGASDGPLGNTMTFDSNIDRIVTPDEFEAGLKRLAKSYANQEVSYVKFESLLTKPNRKEKPRKQPRPEQRLDESNGAYRNFTQRYSYREKDAVKGLKFKSGMTAACTAAGLLDLTKPVAYQSNDRTGSIDCVIPFGPN